MDFEPSAKVRDLMGRVEALMETHVYPPDDGWTIPPVMEELKRKAQAEGLWDLCLAEFEDFFLVRAFSYARYGRIADGPDQAHMAALGKHLIRCHNGQPA